MKNKKEILLAFISLIAGWCIGFCTFQFFNSDPTVCPPDNYAKEQATLDSLRVIEARLEEKRKNLKDSVIKILEEVKEKQKEVENLPVDSGIKFLKEKLEQYE